MLGSTVIMASVLRLDLGEECMLLMGFTTFWEHLFFFFESLFIIIVLIIDKCPLLIVQNAIRHCFIDVKLEKQVYELFYLRSFNIPSLAITLRHKMYSVFQYIPLYLFIFSRRRSYWEKSRRMSSWNKVKNKNSVLSVEICYLCGLQSTLPHMYWTIFHDT